MEVIKGQKQSTYALGQSKSLSQDCAPTSLLSSDMIRTLAVSGQQLSNSQVLRSPALFLFQAHISLPSRFPRGSTWLGNSLFNTGISYCPFSGILIC